MNNNLTQRNTFGSWIAIGAAIGAGLMSAGFGPAALAMGVALGTAVGALTSRRGSEN